MNAGSDDRRVRAREATSPEARLLDLVGDVLGFVGVPELRTGLLLTLARVVSTDYVSINDIGPHVEEVVSLSHPELPARCHAAFARLAHENPLVRRYALTGDGRPRRFSDVATPEQLQATDLHKELYEPLGIRHQVAFTLYSATGRTVGIALSRGDPDFTAADVDLLDRARPYLIQAWRNAIAYSTLHDALMATAAPAQIASAPTAANLTRREAESVSFVALGYSNRDIGIQLAISERTVQKHLQRAYIKLCVRTRSAAGARARELSRASIENRSTLSLGARAR